MKLNLYISTLSCLGLLGLTACSTVSMDRASMDKAQPLKLNWAQNSQKISIENGSSLNVSGSLTPVVATETLAIYANTIDSVNAYNKKSGKLAWYNNYKGGASGLAADKFNAYYSTAGGQLMSVNLVTGSTNWSVPFTGQTVPQSNAESSVLYVYTYKNQLYAINKTDGTTLWTYTHRSESNPINMLGGTKPVVNGALVFIGTSDGYLVALKKSSGDIVWKSLLNENKKLNDLDATPVVDANNIYINSYDGTLYCLNKTTGKTIWSIPAGGGYGVSVSNNRVYFSNSKGEVLSANKESGKEVKTLYKTNKGITTQPILSGSNLIFSESQGSIVNLNIGDNSFKKYSTGIGTIANLAVDANSNIFAASKSAKVYSLKTATKNNLHW